jgi:ribosomal protein S27E
MPNVGDIISGKEIGKPRAGRFIWLECMDCHTERWVQYRNEGHQVIRCFSCNKKAFPARLV